MPKPAGAHDAPPGRPAIRLWAAGMLFLAGEASGYLLPLLLAPIVATYRISESLAGLVIAAQMAAFGIAAIALVPRLSRMSPRRLAFGATVAIVAGNLVSALRPTLETLVAGRVLAGLGEGLAGGTAALLVAQTREPDRAFARVYVAVTIMALMIFLFLPERVAGRDARTLFVALAACTVLALACVPALPGDAVVPPRAKLEGPSAGWTRGALLVCVALTLYSISANAPWFYLERIGTGIGLSPAAFGQLAAAAAVLTIAGPLLAQRLGTRFGRLRAVGLACLVVGCGVWVATHTSAPLAFALGIAVSSAALLFGMPYFLGLAAELDETGGAASACRGFGAAGTALAPAVASGVLALTGSYRSIGWASLIAAVLATALFAAAAATARGRARRR